MSIMDAFLNDPARFMRDNVVSYEGAYPIGAGISHGFTFLRSGSKAQREAKVFLGTTVRKAVAGVFEIRKSIGGNFSSAGEKIGTFNAIWSGFTAGAVAECELTSTGDSIMLTPKLTGCTVVCALRPDGRAYFSHYNLRDPGEPKRTMTKQQITARARADYPFDRVGMVAKEDYYGLQSGITLTRTANVIGWRTGGSWEFWAQYCEETTTVNRIRKIKQLRPGTVFV